MKHYTCTKRVMAAKILGVDLTGESALLDLEDGSSHMMTREWYDKHSDRLLKSLKGGYLVVYQDGYKSWSPAKAFEEGYTEVEG